MVFLFIAIFQLGRYHFPIGQGSLGDLVFAAMGHEHLMQMLMKLCGHFWQKFCLDAAIFSISSSLTIRFFQPSVMLEKLMFLSELCRQFLS